PPVDLSVTITDGVTSAVPGGRVTYTIKVKNNGPNATTGAAVADNLPAAITSATFTSHASGGATGNTPNGAGNIADTVNLPVGAQIVYTVQAAVRSSFTGALVTNASITAPDTTFEINTADNNSSDDDAL